MIGTKNVFVILPPSAPFGYVDPDAVVLLSILNASGVYPKLIDFNLSVIEILQKERGHLVSQSFVNRYFANLRSDLIHGKKALVGKVKCLKYSHRLLLEEVSGNIGKNLLNSVLAIHKWEEELTRLLGKGVKIPDSVGSTYLGRMVKRIVKHKLIELCLKKNDYVILFYTPRRIREMTSPHDFLWLSDYLWILFIAEVIKRNWGAIVFVASNAPLESLAFMFPSNQDTIDYIIDERFFFRDNNFRRLFHSLLIGSPANNSLINTTIHSLSDRPRVMKEPSYGCYSDRALSLYALLLGCKVISISGSIGCPNRCGFCSHWSYRDSVVECPPEFIAKELAHLTNTYHPDFILIQERLLNLRKGRLKELLLYLKNYKTSPWGGYVSASSEFNQKFLFDLAKNGCSWLTVGLESASERVREYMGKTESIADLTQLLKSAKKAGIHTELEVLFGFPKENQDDVDATIDYVYDNYDAIDTVRAGAYLSRQNIRKYLSKESDNGLYTSRENGEERLERFVEKLDELGPIGNSEYGFMIEEGIILKKSAVNSHIDNWVNLSGLIAPIE